MLRHEMMYEYANIWQLMPYIWQCFYILSYFNSYVNQYQHVDRLLYTIKGKQLDQPFNLCRPYDVYIWHIHICQQNAIFASQLVKPLTGPHKWLCAIYVCQFSSYLATSYDRLCHVCAKFFPYVCQLSVVFASQLA